MNEIGENKIEFLNIKQFVYYMRIFTREDIDWDDFQEHMMIYNFRLKN